MAITLYWGSGSPYAWRAMLCAQLSGVAHETKLLSFKDGDIKKPEFLAINPRGKVPALTDGDFAVYESLAIAHYFDALAPEAGVFGRTPMERASVVRHISELESYVSEQAFDLVVPILFPWHEFDEAKFDEAYPKVHAELGRLNAILSEQPYLVSEAPSAADAWLYPALAYLVRGAAKGGERDLGVQPLDEHYPALAAFMERVEAWPGFDATWPAHWER